MSKGRIAFALAFVSLNEHNLQSLSYEYFEKFNGSQADLFTFVCGADESQRVDTQQLKV